MNDVETITDLALRLKMSLSWTQKHWREVPGLPLPFIGREKNQTPRWRRADLDRYFHAEPTSTPAEAPAPPSMAPRSAANPEDSRLTALLRAAGA